ncbi:MAG TPA: hypothetical protein VJV05_02205, partial [Pyrinomonadaceae bacterium]|nr:hypothetical protein [Pyrinomonadaceae bacterium]
MKKLVPVVDTVAADLLTPLGVFLKLSKSGTHSFLLESVEGGESLARYSFIGTSPELVLRGGNESIEINGEKLSTPMLGFLRDHFGSFEIDGDADLPPFVGGAIGYFGFNCASWFEPSLKSMPDEHADAEFMFFNSVIAFDHAKQVIKIITLAAEDEKENALARNAEIRHVLENDPIIVPSKDQRPKTEARVQSNWSREDFENGVREIKEMIL